MSDDLIRLGGRDFQPVVNSTIEHDYWLMARIRRAGLDRVTINPGEVPDEFVIRVLRETIDSGQVFELLGGMLMPADKLGADWTPDMAQATGEFLKGLTKPDDKQIVNASVMSMLSGFFESGLASLVTSPKYSPDETSPPAKPSASAVH